MPWGSEGRFTRKSFSGARDNPAITPQKTQAKMEEPTISTNLLEEIDLLSGSYLDVIDLEGVLGVASSRPEYGFLKVRQYLKRGDPGSGIPFRNEMTDVLIGIYQYEKDFQFIVRGRKNEVNVYYGFPSGYEEYLKAALENAYAELLLDERQGLKDILGSSHQTWWLGLSCGLPSELRDKESFLSEQVERLMRALYGEEYLLAFKAIPFRADHISEMTREINRRLLYLRTEGERLPWEHVRTLQRMYRRTNEILEDCARLGGWSVSVVFASVDRETVMKISSYVKGIYSGEQSYPVPIRTYFLSRPRNLSDALYLKENRPVGSVRTLLRGPLSTIMDSGRASVLCRMPFTEFPGFRVGKSAYFDVHQDNLDAESLDLGKIVMGKRETPNTLQVPLDDLTRHALVAGVTGSGKTNTCMYLVTQLQKKENPIPFMVIESAKATYRKLLNDFGMRDLRVYSLAEETVCHFRMNPFEFGEGTNIQSYINSLYALFNAAFILYAPMPYVLYQALHDIYRDRGWNLATGANERGSGTPYAFPTLTDLYEKIEEVVDSLGYEQRITMDVKAALKTRINSLRIGVKGIMLDTYRSIPMPELMERPTVIELERIGDDEEKAFLIGLLLIKLFEYQKNKGESGGRLRHVTLVEEAHRLLKKVPMEFSTEVSNTRGKALETFCNILSEARAYGEGVIIAEQIPSKLIPDVVKNTNLKIIHRLVDYEERELVGRATNMIEEQREHLSILPRGTAVCHFEGLDLPILVKVPLVIDTLERDEVTPQLRVSESISTVDGFDKLIFRYAGCEGVCNDACRLLDAAREFFEDPTFARRFQSSMFVLFAECEMSGAKEDIFNLMKDDVNRISGKRDDYSLIFCVLVNSFHLFLLKAARQSNIRYEELERAEKRFANLIIEFLDGKSGSRPLRDMGGLLQDLFKGAQKPSPVCSLICGEKGCFFRVWVREACSGESFREWARIYRSGKESGLYDFSIELVRASWPSLFTVKAAETIKLATLCLTYNMMSEYGTPISLQEHRIKRFEKGYPWIALGV